MSSDDEFDHSGVDDHNNNNDQDDDDEFEFAQLTRDENGDGVVNDQHFDEAVSISDDSEADVSLSVNNTTTNTNPNDSMASSVNMDQSLDQSLTHTMDSVTGAAVAGVNITNDEDDSSSGESSSDEDGDENGDDNGDDNGNENAPHLYNPNKYKHLQVSQEIQDLFDHIGRHKPQDIELDTHLKPFIPDYIPAVGEIDAFLKIPKPDGKEDLLGLNVLDEPAARQSHPSVLQIELRMLSKKNHLQNEAVGSIENADKHGKKITTWIQKIEELHRKKPPPHVHYSKTMPDIEQLMQVWPPGFEEVLKNTNLPSADLDMDVKSFAQMVCALLDIPVYEKTTESLHVLFTLYSEFKNNSHFNHE